ncbi:MAG: hypothetical protein Roseis2KO_52020 [Roseivirga sp.]
MGKKKKKHKKKSSKDEYKDTFFEKHFLLASMPKRLIQIAVSILLIIIFYSSKGLLSIIPLIAACFVLLSLRLMLPDLKEWIAFRFNLSSRFTSRFEPKAERVYEVSKVEKVIGHSSTGIMFAGLVLPIFQAHTLGNTFDAWTLVFKSVVPGLAIAIALLIVFQMICPTVYYNRQKRFIVIFSYLSGFLGISAFCGSYINTEFTTDAPSCVHYDIVDWKASESRGRWTYTLSVNTAEGKQERIYVSESFYEAVGPYDEFQVCLITGYLGFRFVDAYYLPE